MGTRCCRVIRPGYYRWWISVLLSCQALEGPSYMFFSLMRQNPPSTTRGEKNRHLAVGNGNLARVPPIRCSHPRLWFGSWCFKGLVTQDSGGAATRPVSRGSRCTSSHQGLRWCWCRLCCLCPQAKWRWSSPSPALWCHPGHHSWFPKPYKDCSLLNILY